LQNYLYKYLHDFQWQIIPIYGITKEGICQCGNSKCRSPGKHPKVSWKRFQETRVTDKHLKAWWRNNDEVTNVGIVTGALSNLVVVDEDKPEAASALNLPKTLTVITSKGRKHFYFKHPGFEVATGPLIPNVDLKGDGGFVVCPPSKHISGHTYKFINENVPMADFPEHILKDRREQNHILESNAFNKTVFEGERNDLLSKLAGSLLGRKTPVDQVFTLLQSHNQTHCEPPLPEEDIKRIVYGIDKAERMTQKKKRPQEETEEVSQFREKIPPKTLSKTAYYGLIGEILQEVDPFTEASKSAILINFLTAFGNLIGRNAYFRAQQDFHYTNLYSVVVGDSATARKGIAWSLVRDLLRPPETKQVGGKFIVNFDNASSSAWEPLNGGIASGEGIIEIVRDDIKYWDPKEKAFLIDEGSGIEDKRALFYEAEFASVLRKAASPTSIIWPVLRSLWDTGSASNTSKHSPIKTHDAHVSVLGNITELELRMTFPQVEMTSGSANRILWICATRSKCLPKGEPLPENIINKLRKEIYLCVNFASKVGELSRDTEAEKLWESFYRQNFESSTNGFLGAILARAEAQVLRLSILYALLDKSKVITRKHLEAAIALWDYAKESARYLFGETTMFPLDNKIINILEDQPDASATRTKLASKLSNNYLARDLDLAFQRLKDSGLIEEVIDKNYTGVGRPSKCIQLKRQ